MDDIARKILGFEGRLISYSKSDYRERFPDNIVVFNSNICTKSSKIWYGDIDISLEREKLKKLAKAIEKNIYVLYEMDGRFENEEFPLLSNFVYRVSPNGDEEINENVKKRFSLKALSKF